MLPYFFICTTLIALILFYIGLVRNQIFLVMSLAWLLIIGIIASTGYFENTNESPPRFLFVILATILLSIFAFKATKKIAIKINYLILLNIVRIPVELILYQLYLQKQVPIIMTFKGWNFDIIIGISVIPIIIFLLNSKKKPGKLFMLLWNIFGILMLTTIVVLAVLSSPLPIQQLAFEQPNIALLQFPYIFLPAYVVPLVYLSHILLIKTYLNER